ncbi:MAG: alpha-galactosidase [Treponema sp.]|nr:alpha-galactosidase [Treponema sp.]
MIPKQLFIEYSVGDSVHFFDGDISLSKPEDLGDGNLKVRYVFKDNRFSLALFPETKITVKQVKISGQMETSSKRKTRYFLNGWQSWTDSREYTNKETEKTVGHMPSFVNKMYGFESYGDYTFCGPKLSKGNYHGWTYAYARLGEDFEFIGSLSETAGNGESLFPEAKKSFAFGLIKFFTKEKQFEVFADADRLEYEISEPVVMIDLALLSGTEDGVFDNYFKIAGISEPDAKPVMGWTSWYDYYQNIDEACLMKNLDALEGGVFQIDDGYEPYVGDWLSVDEKKFPEGLEPVVRRAKEKGVKTGIWFAPFSAEKKSRLFKEHKDWFCKDEKGKPVLCGCNWGGFYGLDIYNDAVRDHIIRSCRHFIDDLGFTLLKIDFLYSVCLVPRKDKTRGQVMHDALEFFRQASKGAELLGCGVPLGSAFGLVDYCRIGTDVSLNWDDKLYMRLCHRERPSTKNTILNSLYRRQLDGRAFLNDPDVFLLRTYNEKLGPVRKSLLSAVNALAGSLVFTSDNVSTYDQEQRAGLEKVKALMNAKILSVDNSGHKISVKYDPLNGESGEKMLRFNRKNGKII